MRHLTFPCLVLLALLATGCSTRNFEPELGAFGGSVDVALKGAEREFKKMKLDDQIKKDRIAALAQVNGYYQLACGDTHVSILAVDVDNPQAITLSDTCPLESFNKDGSPFEYKILDDDLRDAAQARRLVEPMRNYATALSDLAKSKSPEEVSKKFADAAIALQGLASDASKTAGGAGIDPRTQKIIKEGSGLVSILAREGLEAMRYAALRSIIRNGDETVHGAGIIMATWRERREGAAISGRLDVVRSAEQVATDSGFTSTTIAERERLLAAVAEAYDKALEADAAANWRTFIAMVVAHAALSEAFDKPADFAAFKAAHVRLGEFVKQAKKLKAVLDTEG